MMYQNSNNYAGNSNYQLPQRGSNRDGQMHQGMPSNKNNGNPHGNQHGNQPYGGYNQPPNQMRQQQQYGSNFYGQQDMYCGYNNGVVNSNSRYGQMDGQYPPMNSGYGSSYMDQNGKLARLTIGMAFSFFQFFEAH